MADQKDIAERLDIQIEGSTAIWHMAIEGTVEGTYRGTFKFRCYLSPVQQIQANREYREMLGSNPIMVPEHESFLAYALTQLKYRIIESPPFWSSTLQNSSFAGDIPDENVLSAVLDAAISSELKYKSNLKKKRDESLEKAKKAAERILEQQEKEPDEGATEEDGN